MIEINNRMDFQQAFAALRETVAKLENPNTTLDESLALYERSCRLVVYCQRKLNETKKQIVEINERVAELRKSGAPLFED